jgi:hypothetical protein
MPPTKTSRSCRRVGRRLEEYEPDEVDEVPEEYLLLGPFSIGPCGERQVVEAVVAARWAGISWSKIGEILGTSARLRSNGTVLLVEQCDVTPAGAELVPNRPAQPGITHHQLGAVPDRPPVDHR